MVALDRWSSYTGKIVCMGISLGGHNVGRLRRMVNLKGGCLSRFDCMHYGLSNIEHFIGQCLEIPHF